MNRVALLILSVVLISSSSFGQLLPAKIKKYLDLNYTSAATGTWKQAPGGCGEKRWLLTGDFNGDGRTDYLARITVGKVPSDRRLMLIGFINVKGEYAPDAFYDEAYSGEIARSASSVIKKGTVVDMGLGEEGSGPSQSLKNDGVAQFICETDASITYVFADGEFKNIQQTSLLAQTPVIPGPTGPTRPPNLVATPTPTPTPQTKPVVVASSEKEERPNFLGTFTIYKPNGKVDAFIGTVTFENGVITFKLSDASSFTKATAFVMNGVITTGWGRTATASDDGKIILWSDKTKWVRK